MVFCLSQTKRALHNTRSGARAHELQWLRRRAQIVTGVAVNAVLTLASERMLVLEDVGLNRASSPEAVREACDAIARMLVQGLGCSIRPSAGGFAARVLEPFRLLGPART